MNLNFLIGIIYLLSLQVIIVKCYENHTYQCDGYWNNQRCVKCIDANGICTTSSTVINGCKSGYYLKEENGIKTCKACPQDCDKCFEPKLGMSLICTSCKDDTVLIQGTCQEIRNCQVINLTLGSCIQCESGYYMNENKQCSVCDSTCTTCIEGTVCQTCKDGYSFLNKDFTCTLCDNYTTVQKCKACVQSDTKYECSSCLSGYYYHTTSGLCEACPDYCASCILQSNQLKCLQCNTDSNILQNIQGQCLSCIDEIPNCSSCSLLSDKLVCNSCISSFYYNSLTNTCEKCPYDSVCNCKTTSCSQDQTQIVQCPASMNLLNNKCISITNPVQPTIKNCDLLKDESTCSICQSTYYLDSTNGCVSNVITGCLFYQTNEKKCILCSTGYYLYQDICNLIEANCITQSVPGKCTLYKNKYYEDNTGQPVQCNDVSTTQCGFLEISGSTITCNTTGTTVKDCLEYKQDVSGCLIWNKGKRTCSVCWNKLGFYLDTTTGKCGKVQDQCIQIQPGTTKCAKCSYSNNYYVERNGICVICANQASGFYKCQDMLDESIASQEKLLSDESNNANLIKTINFILLAIILLVQ